MDVELNRYSKKFAEFSDNRDPYAGNKNDNFSNILSARYQKVGIETLIEEIKSVTTAKHAFECPKQKILKALFARSEYQDLYAKHRKGQIFTQLVR